MRRVRQLIAILSIAALTRTAFPAAECDGWGEFRGIRVDGQLVPFATSIHMLSADGKQLAISATETVRNPRFTRNGAIQTGGGAIAFGGNNNPQTLTYIQTVTDTGPDTAKVDITATAPNNTDLNLEGIYYVINLATTDYKNGSVSPLPPPGIDWELKPIPAIGKLPDGTTEYVRLKAGGMRVGTPRHSVELTLDNPAEITVENSTFMDTDYQTQPNLRLSVDPDSQKLVTISFPLGKGNLARGQSVHATFTIKAIAAPDQAPATITLDSTKPGAPFDGIGGNFRIQGNQDAAHIAYNLANLRVAWGRVQMPLNVWQPQENVDPTATQPAGATPAPPAGGGRGRGGAGAGGPANNQVRQAMEMARTLADKKIPFIISTWDAPAWALLPNVPDPNKPQGIQARRLNPEKTDAMNKAIVSYLLYMKKNFNAEPALFSFNESDLGINVLYTPQEHTTLIRTLGPMLKEAGLATKLLLADACSPHPVKFVDDAMADPEAVKYIGAVSFHSWHDGTPAEFAEWGKAAQKLNVPLFCGEGGTDADAYRYTVIFDEPWFALNEINTYVQMMEYGRVSSVLHWQLTENYSVLKAAGGGGRGQPAGPLQPTRRFYHLKQLNLTPANAPSIGVTTDQPTLTVAAYSDNKAAFALHIINNGPDRETTISNIPAGVTQLHAIITDATKNLADLPAVTVAGGRAEIVLPRESFVTLLAP